MPHLPNDPLAAQLNDLAIANQDGLLNDDEYRLLRQNLFERYSGGAEIVSVSSTRAVKPAPASRRKHVELVEQPSPRSHLSPPRSKISGVADFLRRATGRRPTSPSPPPNVIKLSLIPRMFSKKSEDSSSSDTDSSGRTSSSASDTPKSKPRALAPASPTRAKTDPISPMRTKFEATAVPTSPSRSAFAISPAPVAGPSKYDVIPGGSNDIFDDDNLHTSDAIRKVIAAVEAEGRRLITAFNDLETSAVIRYRQEHPQRQSARRPATAISPVPSINGSAHTLNSRARSNSQRQNLNALSPDTQSVRSNSSLRTTKSSASLFHSSAPSPPLLAFSHSTPPPSSGSGWGALSPKRLPSLRRKASTSSLASQGAPSFLSVNRATASPSPNHRPNLSRSSSMSRSTGHLPLPVPAPVPAHGGSGSGSTMMELLAAGDPVGEGGEELAEVRRRRAEMVGRCEARLEYLRAKLKGAQIHEKLLKK
ncbi:hypothetical protein C8F04DRAFT_1397867 [Mycena alexandri]|uniref:Uncharacterized protein n=1 Tax=Mycena alexandri TaxID=1745969 RepID=A0AAD6SQ41_9AGAR|nr:hypothetical protein C8F04DRAFT_1397867 [Mycena alexandri]